jgi:general stress protein YciG
MGFQHFKPIVHEAASRKGGKIKVVKGFGKNPELARLAGSKGGKAKHANRSKEKPDKEEAYTGGERRLLEKLLDYLDEQVQE